jgi:cell wall-associated NlpC family hydrolase
MTLSEYATYFIGVKYHWGGDTVEQGFDCGGFIQEVLSCRGLDPRGDQNAQMLYNYFNSKRGKSKTIKSDSLLFFGKDTKRISHIAMAINDFQD